MLPFAWSSFIPIKGYISSSLGIGIHRTITALLTTINDSINDSTISVARIHSAAPQTEVANGI